MTEDKSPPPTTDPTEPHECPLQGAHPVEHCGDIFCPVCPSRFSLEQKKYERIELDEYFGTYDTSPPDADG